MHNLPFDEALFRSPFYRRGMTRTDVPASVNPEDILKLSSNENPFGVSPAVAAAIKEQADIMNQYPPREGDKALCGAIAELHGGGVSAEHVVLGKGGLDIMDMAIRGFVRPGDNVIICNPTFGFLRIGAIRVGAEVIDVPLVGDEYRYDVDGVLAAVNERTRIVYLCNPNNPTGNVTPADALDRLVTNLPNDVLLISDEAYSHFAAPMELPDTMAYVLQGRPVLKLFSFSKAFGLAGLRLGYAVTPPDVAAYLAGYKTPFHIGRITVAAGLAAVADQEYMADVVRRNRSGREWLTGQAQELGLKVWPSGGNFLLMSAPNMDGSELTAALLQHGVIVSDGGVRFGLPDHIRLTVGTEKQNQRVVDVLAQIMGRS